MQGCYGAFALAMIFVVLLKDLLLVYGFKVTKGNAHGFVKIQLAFDVIIIVTSWMLYAMTSGVCGS